MGRRPGKSLTRGDVIAAAIRVVEAEGADALGVSRVASELGIKPPSIYNHVGKGDALPLAVSIQGNRMVFEFLRDEVAGIFDARRQLEALAHATRRWARENPGLYQLMSQAQPDNRHPDFQPILIGMLDLFGRPLEAMGVDETDTVHAIRALRAAVHGFVVLELSGSFALPESTDESFSWLVRTVLAGIG